VGGGTKKRSLDLEAYPISHIAAVTWIFYVLVGSMLLKIIFQERVLILIDSLPLSP
jgi:hypothetical protein